MHGPRDTRTPDELAKLGYERADIGLRTIAIWVFWFFFFTVISGAATALIYWRLAPSKFMPAQVEQRSRFPAEPRLQDDIRVKTDIYDLRREEDAILAATEPGPNGETRIPIDQAMTQYADRFGHIERAEGHHPGVPSLNPGPNAYVERKEESHEGESH